MNDTSFTPNPEPIPGPTPGPIPGPFPGPMPGPFPKPIPWPIPEPIPWPPDWWHCLRLGPVSGRYEGSITPIPIFGGHVLDLRVDIDPRYANSPVLNRVSGDIFQEYRVILPPFPPGRIINWRIFRESWIIDTPTVNWSRCQVEITGRVRYWKGGHPETDVRIIIPWGALQPAGTADVTFTEVGGSTMSYSCPRRSNHFRVVTLEVDVCNSVNAEPILPSYGTCAHPNHPADLPCRTLTIEEAYKEAGIDLNIDNPARTIIDDSAPEFSTWSDDELHDCMELHFNQFPGTWPKWRLWGLMAGRYDISGVAGIMFDYGTAYGGPGRAPERQGSAVFRSHLWFNNLVLPPPANDDQAWAMRQFLYTYVHEIGHAFNLLHSWDKGRPNALSWMNYPQNVANFWDNFRFRFDDEELIHLRHGDRSEVIPGGDPWSTGWHLEAPPGAMADLMGEAPVELLLRSKGYFQFMEPVIIELRIRNTTDTPLELDTQLHPEFGGVIIYIRRPDRRILEYAPIACKLAIPELKVLKPIIDETIEGEDRHSQNVFLSYGAYGYYFDEPGEYLIRALYQGSGAVLIPSNVHRVRIGRPFEPEEERIAQDFFSYEAGMALYLNGSSSPFLKEGMDTLEIMADRYQNTPVGAQLSLVLAQNLARPFFRVEKNKLVKFRDSDPEEALALTTRAADQQKKDESTFTNISYHQLYRTRANLLVATGKKADAKKELKSLSEDLKKRGVNQPVLDQIDAYAKGL